MSLNFHESLFGVKSLLIIIRPPNQWILVKSRSVKVAKDQGYKLEVRLTNAILVEGLDLIDILMTKLLKKLNVTFNYDNRRIM